MKYYILVYKLHNGFKSYMQILNESYNKDKLLFLLNETNIYDSYKQKGYIFTILEGKEVKQ